MRHILYSISKLMFTTCLPKKIHWEGDRELKENEAKQGYKKEKHVIFFKDLLATIAAILWHYFVFLVSQFFYCRKFLSI